VVRTREYEFPQKIDLLLTGKCNQRCPFCFGPDHDSPDELSTEQWLRTQHLLIAFGAVAFVYSGGEPLLRDDANELMWSAKKQGARVTLSTNGLLVCDHLPEIGLSVHEIGIPIDGSNQTLNSQMRPGNQDNLRKAISAIEQVKRANSGVEVTVRTVITALNCEDILKIGRLVASLPVDRWKLYEFAPIGYGALARDRYQMSPGEFEEVVKLTKDSYPQISIRAQRVMEQPGKYIFVTPQGNVLGIGPNLESRYAGNACSSPTDCLRQRIVDLVVPGKHRLHN
jgi:Fe-coproporphyrin III synthase